MVCNSSNGPTRLSRQILSQFLDAVGVAASPDSPVTSKFGKRKSSDESDHVWAGNFLACWGSANLDQPDLVAAAMKKGVVQSDSNLNRAQIAAWCLVKNMQDSISTLVVVHCKPAFQGLGEEQKFCSTKIKRDNVQIGCVHCLCASCHYAVYHLSWVVESSSDLCQHLQWM